MLYEHIEGCLIRHCSPTLAALKTAGLFSMKFSDKEELDVNLNAWNSNLSEKGVMLISLNEKNNRALIYVFRKKQLQQDLERPSAKLFLQKNGYSDLEIEAAITTLRNRLELSSEFPHEIGIFLGYPAEDVIGFIQNKGLNCRYSGCWKVYYNECEAKKLFAKYKKCEYIYARLWEQGKSILRLTVAKE